MVIQIRKYQPNDFNQVINICYKTGFMGEDLTNKKIFGDKKLFGLLFCAYYPKYEPENCFVATSDDLVIGYIIGSLNTKNQIRQFFKKMVPWIILRLVSFTIWRHIGTVKQLFKLAKKARDFELPDNIIEKYPAHLHINILDGYQRNGVGSRLIETYEEKVKSANISGLHLTTTMRNVKAVPFYFKHNYSILYEIDKNMWDNSTDIKTVTFGKFLI